MGIADLFKKLVAFLGATGNDTYHRVRRDAANPIVYACPQGSWQGRCDWLTATDRNCHNYNTQAGSFGPEPGIACNVYSQPDCTGDYAGGIRFPGFANWEEEKAKNLLTISFPVSYRCARE